MQRISLAHLRPGMVTAKSIYSADGRILLGVNVELTEKYIMRLDQMGILAAYIRNPYFEDALAPEIVPESMRVRLIQIVQQQFLAIRENKPWDVAAFAAGAEQIVGEIEKNPDPMVQLTDIRPHNEFTFGHSVNVAVLCALIGAALNYPRHKLVEIALGGLLHDVGKMKIDPGILNKPTQLTPIEYRIMQTHAEIGFELLRHAGAGMLSLKVMHMAFQHQEKPDGTGYPRQLNNKSIHEYAKIASIADVYDAVTCDRPYHRGLFPHEAALRLAEGMGKQFDANVLTAFLTRIAIYSIGSVVALSTGEIAVVNQTPWGMQNRPIVRLMLDKNKNPVRKKVTVDLRDHPGIDIQCALNENDVNELGKLAI